MLLSHLAEEGVCCVVGTPGSYGARRVVGALHGSEVHGVALHNLLSLFGILRWLDARLFQVIGRVGKCVVVFFENHRWHMPHIAHDELDSAVKIAGVGVAHLAFLRADHRAPALSKEFKQGDLASAIQEQRVGVENIYGQEAIIEVTT